MTQEKRPQIGQDDRPTHPPARGLVPQKASRFRDLALPPNLMGLAEAFALSGYFQDARDAGQAIVKIQAGQELGVSPVASMMGIYIVKGRIMLGSNIIASLVKRSGRYDYRVTEHSDEACSVEFSREGKVIGISRFTQADAKRAGLIRSDSAWNSYPRNMLFARALSNGAKWFCPEVMSGSALPVNTAAPERADDGETYKDDVEGEIIEGTTVDHIVDRETGEIIEEVPEVHEPPEGHQPDWFAFWAKARKERRLMTPEVHRMFIPQQEGESDEAYFERTAKNGALVDWVIRQAQEKGQTEAEIVAWMIEELASRPTPREPGKNTAKWR